MVCLVDCLSLSHSVLFLGFCSVLSFGIYCLILAGFYELGKMAISVLKEWPRVGASLGVDGVPCVWQASWSWMGGRG